MFCFQARILFLKGVQHEQEGKLYEAIQYYRRAVQLVPDIEFRIYESNKLKLKDKLETDSSEGKARSEMKKKKKIILLRCAL